MQQQMSFLDSAFGKTSQVPSQATADATSTQSSKRSAPSVSRTAMFLDLRTGAGNLLGAYWETGTVLPGGFMMHNTGESRSVAVESFLSQILDLNAPEKYCLSRKACLGIIRRARKRGKVLPDMLREALTEVAGSDGAEENDEDIGDDDFDEEEDE